MIMLISYPVDAKVRIHNIKYQGNEKTQERLLNNALYIKAGDVLDHALIERSKQAIMDIGLFKSVNFQVKKIDHNEYADEEDTYVDIVFVVKEKIYLLVVPRLKIDDDKVNVGMQLKWDNIFGLDHKMKAVVVNRGSTLGIKESRRFFSYSYPNVNNSVYSLDFLLREENLVDEEKITSTNRQDDSLGFGVSRWLNSDGHNRGWFMGGSFLYQKRINEDLFVSENSNKINAVVLGFDMGYKNLNNFKYNRGGKDYGYQLSWSDEDLGSETKFARHLFYYRSYYRFNRYPLANLNVQFKFGHSNEDILGDKAFNLGSRNDLRGYENNRFSGNTLFLMNYEYMFPHPDHPVIRYVTFIDMGNTYDSLSDVLNERINIGAGIGLRWKIRSFVKIDLRADVGYGFTDDSYKFSFGTRHAF